MRRQSRRWLHRLHYVKLMGHVGPIWSQNMDSSDSINGVARQYVLHEEVYGEALAIENHVLRHPDVADRMARRSQAI